MPLKRGLLAVPILVICISIIYAAIIREDNPVTPDIPTATSMSLAIPGVGNGADNQEPASTVVVEPDVSPSAPQPTSSKIIPIPNKQPDPNKAGDISISLPLPEPKTTPETAKPQDQPDRSDEKWLEETVHSGDSLARIFNRLGLSAKLLHRITTSGKEARGLTNIKPGESLRIRLDDQGRLQELIYQRSAVEALHLTPDGDGFRARTETRQVEKRLGYLSGTIVSSFYLSAQKAGLSDALIMDLATIFGWDIDFALEIRKGDRFSVVYEEEFLNGTRHGNGRILAAEFVNRGKVYRAIRHEKASGESDYYSPNGNSMRKAFLRAPVDFRRISSRFTKERFHPVLGKKRPHRGVDYAAATGTPIKAAGDGRVIFRGTKGGYGRTIILKHGSQYTTLYAHLSRYRSKVKNGTRVKQGQTIGYVGKSGLATGPHLHYEFRVNGRHRNPLTVKLPASAPIEKRYKRQFLQHSKRLAATLDLLTRSMLAQTTKQ
jgi:murein DD-endopeptidase MepM/ murein hydrolase activator NlpD